MLPSMLRKPRVMANVRSSGWCHSQRNPSASSSLNGRRSTAGVRSPAGARLVATIAEHEPGGRRRTCRRRTRSAGRTRSAAAGWRAAGRGTGWRRSRPSTSGRWPARGRAVVDDRRHERLGAVVVEHLARAEQQRGDERSRGTGTTRCRRPARPRRARRSTPLAREHGHAPPAAVSTARIALAPTISRRRSLRSVMTPAGSVNSSHGRRWTTPTRAISSGLRVIAEASHG